MKFFELTHICARPPHISGYPWPLPDVELDAGLFLQAEKVPGLRIPAKLESRTEPPRPRLETISQGPPFTPL